MSQPKFIHDDIVRVTTRGDVGTVKEVHNVAEQTIYTVELKSVAGERVDVPESELEMVQIANDDETGFAIRYIS